MLSRHHIESFCPDGRGNDGNSVSEGLKDLYSGTRTDSQRDTDDVCLSNDEPHVLHIVGYFNAWVPSQCSYTIRATAGKDDAKVRNLFTHERSDILNQPSSRVDVGRVCEETLKKKHG
nr:MULTISPECIES: hypothetical protein [Streptomyces]